MLLPVDGRGPGGRAGRAGIRDPVSCSRDGCGRPPIQRSASRTRRLPPPLAPGLGAAAVGGQVGSTPLGTAGSASAAPGRPAEPSAPCPVRSRHAVADFGGNLQRRAIGPRRWTLIGHSVERRHLSSYRHLVSRRLPAKHRLPSRARCFGDRRTPNMRASESGEAASCSVLIKTGRCRVRRPCGEAEAQERSEEVPASPQGVLARGPSELRPN